MNSLSYPDRWWIDGYSPPVEDIQDAYVKGQVSDHALESEIEWALSHPEPPATVLIDDDEALISVEQVSNRTLELAEDDSTTVSIGQETVMFHAYNWPVPEQNVLSFQIECHKDEVQAVFDSLTDGESE